MKCLCLGMKRSKVKFTEWPNVLKIPFSYHFQGCFCDISSLPLWIFSDLLSLVRLGRKMNWLRFGVKRSKVKVAAWPNILKLTTEPSRQRHLALDTVASCCNCLLNVTIDCLAWCFGKSVYGRSNFCLFNYFCCMSNTYCNTKKTDGWPVAVCCS